MKLVENRKETNWNGEFVYATFLLSGFFKQYLHFFDFNRIDFTLLVAVLLLAKLCFSYLHNQSSQIFKIEKLISLSLIFSFTASVLVSMFYTHSTQFYLVKFINFGVCIVAYVFPLIMNRFDFQRFLRHFINISILFVAIFFALFSFSNQLLGLEEIRNTYLVIGYLSGLNLLLLLSVHRRGKIITLLFIIVLLMSGSRAPIISTILVYLIMIFFFRKGLRLGYQLKSIVINALLFVLLVFFFRSNELAQSMLDASVNRMMVLYSDIGGNNSAQARVGHIYNSIDHISEKPFMGYGFGSYGVVSTGLDIRSYPHNSILEVWFELGLFGLISFLSIILFHTIWNFWKISAGAGMVTVYMFLNSLSSSSFSELKIEFGLFSVFLLMSKSKSNVN